MANYKKKKAKKNNQKTLSEVIVALSLFIVVMSILIFKQRMGVFGKYFSQGFFIIFGITSYLLPIYFLYLFFAIRNKVYIQIHKKNIIVFSLILLVIFIFITSFISTGQSYKSFLLNSYNQALTYNGMGVLFTSLYFILSKLIGNIGIYVLTGLTILLSYVYFFDISLEESIIKISTSIKMSMKSFFSNFLKNKNNRILKKKNDIPKNILKLDINNESKISEKNIKSIIEDNGVNNPKISYHNSETKVLNHDSNDEIEKEIRDDGQIILKFDDEYDYVKPPIDLLNKSKNSASDDKNILLKNAEIIRDTLESFDINSEVVNINSGPTVTSYEVKPQSGIKVEKIVNLSNNLAMALASPSIRIEAPIPGKPYVGIEVPNLNKDVVTFRSLISNEEFSKHDDDITVVIGKDIFGKPLFAKINEMPHLLIAGATGSGKSVLMNSIIMSIIYKYTPNEVEFIMVDPKMVELKIYSGIPHLKGRKVVTKAQEATASLHEAVREMTERFELFSEAGARDIKAYNQKVEEDEDKKLKKLSYLVVIIDELSDLMMEASKDVENYITRLAQMGRASGVHLIIATQRPSVNVITGIIKANIPSRIAFQVASNVDSRTIIDSSGAEKLLGKGDMLYYPSKYPKPKRAQGAFVTDQEVERVVTYVKEKNIVEKSNEDFNKKIQETSKPQDNQSEVDELYEDAVRFVLMENSASISAIQRRFRVGYARAGRIVDQMTLRGIISEQDGAKPRNVLISLEDYEKQLGQEND